MLAKLTELKEATRTFQGDVWLLRGERDGPGRSKDGGMGQWQEVEGQRKLVKGLVKDVVELVGRELRGEA